MPLFNTRFVAKTLFFLIFLGMFGSVEAQEMTLAPSRAVACLTRKDGKDDKLQYPEESLTRKDGGLIKVEMTFNAPDRAPRVKTDNKTGSSLLDEAVSDYVDGFRLPCMNQSEGPVTLRQEYIFSPNDGRKVMSTRAKDDADEGRLAQLACIKNIEGKDKPNYPANARRNEAQGKFLVEMSFSSPDKAPELRWLSTAKNMPLRWAVEEYMQQLRMPCLHGEPVRSNIMFDFKIIDGERTVMRDLSLKQFVASSKDIPTPAYFDLTTMACPFDLRIRYMRPYEDNIVSELDTTNPSRKPFIDWLAKLTLNIPDDLQNKVLSDSFTLSVPCGSVNL